KVSRGANFDLATFAAKVNGAQMDISGAFTARQAHFNSPSGPVDFTGLKIGADACFTNATFAGPVTFQYAHSAENWRFDGSVFTNAAAFINFEAVKAGAATSFARCRFAGYVSFKDARFAELDFSTVTWPDAHGQDPSLWLNGMTY